MKLHNKDGLTGWNELFKSLENRQMGNRVRVRVRVRIELHGRIG